MVDAIVNLLREAEPEPQTETIIQPIIDKDISFDAPRDPANSRYGILLLRELCKPRYDLCVVSHTLSSVFICKCKCLSTYIFTFWF